MTFYSYINRIKTNDKYKYMQAKKQMEKLITTKIYRQKSTAKNTCYPLTIACIQSITDTRPGLLCGRLLYATGSSHVSNSVSRNSEIKRP